MAKVKYLGSTELYIGENKPARVSFVEIKPEVVNKEYINHHILLADVSGSMSGNIKTLKERLITTLKALLLIPDSFVSVITYSGHQQSKRIINGVKCEQVAYQMADVWNILEEELYIKSVTVISEPLEQSIEICKLLAHVCNKHHIAIFTDGCLVPSRWDETLEREKCFRIAEICNKEGIFLNAIGFGQYYDRAFLKELIELANNGAVIHIDEIKVYSDVILDIIKKVNSEQIISADLSVSEGKLFNISSSAMKSSIGVRNFQENGNIFAVIESQTLNVDGERYSLDFNKKISDSEITDNFCYSLARYYLQEEDIDNMEFIIKALGDVALYEQVQNCYSFIEKGNSVNKITEALENKSKRFVKGRNPIVESESEKQCILEILQRILQDKESELYWDVNTPYHRITQHTKQVEDAITFKRRQEGLVPITSISIGSEKLNIGIKVRIDGEVSDQVSGIRKEACIYRDFNIVNSGNINVPYINAKLSKDLYDQFLSEGIILQTSLYSFVPHQVYTLNLQGIKSTNKRILKAMSMTEIAEKLYHVSDLKCKQWAINQLIKEATASTDELAFTELPEEEKEIRRILRIDEKGIYSPASIEKDNDTLFEIYPAIFLTWDIKKFPEKSRKELHLNQLKLDILNRNLFFGKHNKEIYDYLSQELSQVRSEMRSTEFQINSVRIASAITNKSPFMWEETGEKAKTVTDKVLNRNMVVGGKLKFFVKTISDKVVEQQKWVQLIKCN